MPIAVTFLEQDRQRPEDIAALLADFLSAAKTSLSIAVYNFRLSGRAADLVVNALRLAGCGGRDAAHRLRRGQETGRRPVADTR